MPSTIVYCEKCGKLIPPSEVARNKAVVFGDGGVCPDCVSGMSPAELRQIRARFPGPPTSPQPPRRAPPVPVGGPRPLPRPAGSGTGSHAARGPNKGVAIAAFGVAILVGVGVVVLVASRSPSDKGKPPATGSVGGSTAKPAKGSVPRRGASAEPADSPARRRLNEIKAMTASSLERYAEARAALVKFAAETDDRACAAEAEGLVTKIDANFLTFADGELVKSTESVDALISNDKLAEARKAVEGFGERFAGTGWFKSRGEKAVAKALAEIDAARVKALEALVAQAHVAQARTAFEAEDFAQARAALEPRAEWPDEFRAQADGLIKKMAEAEAEQEALAKLAAAWGAFPPGFMDAGKQGLEPAKAYLKEQRKVLDELGAGAKIKKKLTGIERLFRGAALVEDLAEIGFQGARGTVYFHWKGERVNGKIQGVDGRTIEVTTTRGRQVKAPIAEIAGADVVRYSRILRRATSEKSRAAAYLFLRGDPEAAREVLKDASGDGVSETEDRIAEFMQIVEEEKERKRRESAKTEAARIAAEARAATAEAKALAGATAERARATLGAGLIAHWRFDDKEGSAVKDSSANGYHGSIEGGAQWVEGKLGGGLDMHTQQKIKMPGPSGDMRSFSVAFWLKPRKLADHNQFVGPGWGKFLFHVGAGGGIYCGVHNRFDPKNIPAGTLTTDTWQHIAYTYDGATARFYKDGRELASKQERAPNRWDGFTVGLSDRWVRGVNGALDDLRVYDRALSTETLKELASGREPEPEVTLTTGLVGHWKLDDRQGTVAKDSSGNGNDGAVKGAAKWTRGKRSGALYLSGNNSGVRIENEAPFDITERITVAIWMKSPPFTKDHQAIVTKGDDAWRLQRNGEKRIVQWACTGLSHSDNGSVTGRAIVDDGKWHHLAGVYDGTTSILYVDGKVDGLRETSGSIKTSDARVFIGHNAQREGRRLAGMVDDVRVYSRALSAEEVRTLAGAPPPIPKAGTGGADGGPADEPGDTPRPAASGAGLVKNGGFEEKSARGFASEWKKEQWGARGAGSSVRLDRSNPRTGESALVVRGLADGSKPGASTALRLDIGTYEIRYWASADVGKTATIGVRFADTELPGHEVPDRWTQFTETVTVEKKNLSSGLGLWTSTVNVRVWFDDVELVRK